MIRKRFNNDAWQLINGSMIATLAFEHKEVPFLIVRRDQAEADIGGNGVVNFLDHADERIGIFRRLQRISNYFDVSKKNAT